MYPYYAPQMTGLKGRSVSSLEEAKAAMIDFDGSIFLFPDLTNKKIYTKQLNMDGTCSLRTYQLLATDEENKSQFITREEFEKFVSQIQSKDEPSAEYKF